MSKTASQQEPETATIEMWRGRPAPAKPDYIGTDPTQHRQVQQNNQRIEWERELEQQVKSKAVKRLADQPRVDLVSELDSALTTLEAGAVDFEKSHGQLNSELIESRKLVAETNSQTRRRTSQVERNRSTRRFGDASLECRIARRSAATGIASYDRDRSYQRFGSQALRLGYPAQ